jgi:hypothetical protein
MAFSEATQTFDVGTCESSTVVLTNSLGKPAALTTTKTLEISQEPATLELYEDSVCTKRSAGVFTVPVGADSYVFYMKSYAAGKAAIRAQIVGLPAVTQTETMTGLAARVAFSTTAQSFPPNTCTSSTVLITTNIGQPATLTAAKALDISGAPTTLGLYEDSLCTKKSAAFTLPAGTDSFVFYMKSSESGTITIKADIPNAALATPEATQTETVTLPTTGSGPQNPPTSAPSQASQAGYTNLVFDDEFNSADTISPAGTGSYNWYTTNFFAASATLPNSGYSVQDGFLTINTDASGYSDGIATADPTNTSQVWQHAYFEASIRFSPTGHTAGTAWPAFWSYSIEQATGTVPSGDPYGELDFMEYYPTGTTGTYITTVHQWVGNTSEDQNSNNVPTIPATTDFTQFHTYGCLWVPNQIEWYFDNQLVTTVPTGPGTDFTGIEDDHVVVILGTGKNWPMDVDFVHVWQ